MSSDNNSNDINNSNDNIDNDNENDILNISQIKKNIEKFNPNIKEKSQISSSNKNKNKSSPKSYRKYNTLNNISNLIEKNNIEKENIELKKKIEELEKENKKQKMKYKNQIKLLKEEFCNKNHDINSYDENNMVVKMKEYKKKINLLSDENISLLTEIKNLKKNIMNLKKDKQYLIEQITELNMALNYKIKPKLNENEDSLMYLKNQIIKLKNKNNNLTKENNLQKEIIKDLKDEIYDIHQKTSILCKNNSHTGNYNTNIKNKNKNKKCSVKPYLSMKNLKKKIDDIDFNYRINNDDENSLYKENNLRINTENNLVCNNPFYRSKNNYNYKRSNNDNISSIINNIINAYKTENNKAQKYKKTSYNMKYDYKNKKLLINTNRKTNLDENNKENYNYNEINKYNYKDNKKIRYIYPYYKSSGKIINTNKLEDDYECTKNEKSKINISSYKSLLSEYIDEDNLY